MKAIWWSNPTPSTTNCGNNAGRSRQQYLRFGWLSHQNLKIRLNKMRFIHQILGGVSRVWNITCYVEYPKSVLLFQPNNIDPPTSWQWQYGFRHVHCDNKVHDWNRWPEYLESWSTIIFRKGIFGIEWNKTLENRVSLGGHKTRY